VLLRKIGASKEQARREKEAEERAINGYDGTQDDNEDDMEF
jgi:GINS complex subunit 2